MREDFLKDYVEVNERIMKFYEKYPEGSIQTELLQLDWEKGIVLMKAYAYRHPDDKRPATGHAYEKETDGYINKTSMIENCYHEDTEILTINGWIKIKDLINSGLWKTTKVAQVDLKTNKLEFEYPLDCIIQPNRNFYLIEDNKTCQVVTPEHYVIIDNQKIMAHQIVTNKYGKNITNNIKNDFIHETEGIKETEDFIRILQWVIADGYIDYKHNHIKFGFTKLRKVKRLIELLEKENIAYTTSFNDKGIHRINIKGAERIIKYLPNRKTLSFELAMALNKEQAKVFIEEIKYTDGYLDKKGAIYLRQTDKEYFDNLSLLAIKAGYDVLSPSVDTKLYKGRFNNAKPIYRIRIKQNARRTHTKKEIFCLNKTAYCLVMPKGTLVTKFNNKITVSSNCETSAVGRALAMLGLEVRKAVASKEEVARAIEQQEKAKEIKLITKSQLAYINSIFKKLNFTDEKIKEIIKKYNASRLEEITSQDASKLINELQSYPQA